MAIEIFPDSPSSGMSPRISFSHDLLQTDVVPIEQYIRSGSSSSIDFDFCVFRETFERESSAADELFFDGKILPIEIKKRLPAPPVNTPPLPPTPPKNTTTAHETEEKHPPYNKPSFWGFKRSTSLNCGTGYARTLCPLPLLSRSNSTGSAGSQKRASLSNNQKQSPLKQPLFRGPSYSNIHQRPPLKKNNNHYYNNGIKINPVLNVPHGNIFRLGSIFSGGKDKDKTKKKY